MKINKTKVITCFFGTHPDLRNHFINVTVFDPEKNFEIIKSNITTTTNITKFHNIKSAVMTVDGRQKALACATITKDNSYFLFYVGYDIISNSLYEGYIINPNNCTIISEYFTISYFRETEEFIISVQNKCQSSSSLVYSVYSFNNNFDYSFYGTISKFILSDSNSACENFPSENNIFHNIVFSSFSTKILLCRN